MRIRNGSDKYLIVEQKGLRVVLLGVFISLIFGLTIRAIFSPARIQFEIERIISNSKPRAEIKVGNAYLSLADGIFPRVAIVVENLDIQSHDACLFFPSVKINSLILPVAFDSIIERKFIVSKIDSDFVNIRFGKDNTGCSDRNNSATKPGTEFGTGSEARVGSSSGPDTGLGSSSDSGSKAGTGSKTGTGIGSSVGSGASLATVHSSDDTSAAGLTSKTNTTKALNPPIVQTLTIQTPNLEDIRIENLEIRDDKWPGVLAHFQSTEASIDSTKAIRVNGHLQLVQEDLPSIHPINGRYAVEWASGVLTGTVEGIWREGSYEIGGSYDSTNNQYKIKGDIKQMPLNQILPLMKHYNIHKQDISGRKSWVSFAFDLNSEEKQKIEGQLENLRFEGEFGEVISNKILITKQKESFKFSPVQLRFNEIDLDGLFGVLDIPHPGNFLNHLGSLTGNIIYRDENIFNLDATWKGLELVFSNKGRRDVQVIQQAELELRGAKENITGSLSKISPDSGEFIGKIEFKQNKQNSLIEIKVNFNDLKLHPRIVKLMTSDGKVENLSGQFTAQIEKNIPTFMHGQLSADDLELEKIEFKNLKVEFDKKDTELLANVKSPEAFVKSNSEAYRFLKVPISNLNEGFIVKNLSSIFRGSGQNFEWKNLSAQVPQQKTKITSDGGWNPENMVFGTMHLASDSGSSTWEIGGSRLQPTIAKREKSK